MITWPSVPIYLHRQPVDFRKAINGLAVIVDQEMSLDVCSEALFVFCNKNRSQLKVLYWDIDWKINNSDPFDLTLLIGFRFCHLPSKPVTLTFSRGGVRFGLNYFM